MSNEEVVELHKYIDGQKEAIIFGCLWVVESYEKHGNSSGRITLINGCNFNALYQGNEIALRQQKMELTDEFFLEIMKQWRT